MKGYKITLQVLSAFKVIGSISGIALVATLLFGIAQGGSASLENGHLAALDIYSLVVTFGLGVCNLLAGIFGWKGAGSDKKKLTNAILLGWVSFAVTLLDAVIVVFLFETPIDMVSVAVAIVTALLFVFAASRLRMGAQE